jgi:hypothetical protein
MEQVGLSVSSFEMKSQDAFAPARPSPSCRLFLYAALEAKEEGEECKVKIFNSFVFS